MIDWLKVCTNQNIWVSVKCHIFGHSDLAVFHDIIDDLELHNYVSAVSRFFCKSLGHSDCALLPNNWCLRMLCYTSFCCFETLVLRVQCWLVNVICVVHVLSDSRLELSTRNSTLIGILRLEPMLTSGAASSSSVTAMNSPRSTTEPSMESVSTQDYGLREYYEPSEIGELARIRVRRIGGIHVRVISHMNTNNKILKYYEY